MPKSESTPNGSLLRRADRQLDHFADAAGNLMVNAFHQLALFAIGAATVWAAVVAFADMVRTNHTSIEALLLLFIYLEIGAMVGIYFKTRRMPVRFLIYVAITVLTRLLISLGNHHEKVDAMAILIVSGGILLLCGAALLLRFASYKYPTDPGLTKAVDDDS